MTSATIGTPVVEPDEEAAPGTSRKVAAASVGGVLAALLASLCCGVGSLVLVALGMGVGTAGFLAGTSVLSVLVPYCPLFIVLALLGIGISFYVVYTRPNTAGATTGTCAISRPRALRVFVWVAGGTVLALILSSYVRVLS